MVSSNGVLILKVHIIMLLNGCFHTGPVTGPRAA